MSLAVTLTLSGSVLVLFAVKGELRLRNTEFGPRPNCSVAAVRKYMVDSALLLLDL
jgi:hypothetical protein